MKVSRSSFTGALLLYGGLVALPACNPDTDPGPQGDSHTNWLRTCGRDAECGDLRCICGVCTLPCRHSSECSGASGYACVVSTEEGPVSACAGTASTGGMCVPSCADSECALGLSCLDGACVPAKGATARVTVDAGTTLQTLIGFGATIGYAEDELASLSDRVALDADLFDGLGLDVLRFRSRYGEVEDARLAQAQALVAAATSSLGRKPLVLLASWSPPAGLKQNGARFCGDGPATCTLRPQATGAFDYRGLAVHWRETLEAYAAVGFVPDYIGIQNNPDWAPVTGVSAEACKFLPSEGTESVLVDGRLTPVRYPGYAEAMRAVLTELSSLPSMPKLLAPDLVGVRGAERYFDALGDTRVDAIAHHFYGADAAALDLEQLSTLGQLQSSLSLPVFQTEMQADGFDTAVLIHHALVSEGAAMYLQTALVAPRTGPATNPMALVGLNDGEHVLQEPYFAMRHYSKYTEPGYARVAASSTEPSLLVSAFRAPEGEGLTVVLVNSGSLAQTVKLDAGTSRGFSLSRTVFGGQERMADLGAMPGDSVIALPPRSMATARFE